MAISLIAYAKADIRASKSALEAVRAGEGNEKATKGVAAYHAQQAIEKIIKAEIYKVNSDFFYSGIQEKGKSRGNVGDFAMIGTFNIEKGQKLTEEQLREIEETKKHP